MPPAPNLPADCLLRIVHLAACPEPGAAAGSSAYLRELLAVGGVCRGWREATLHGPYNAAISWAQLRRFAAQARCSAGHLMPGPPPPPPPLAR